MNDRMENDNKDDPMPQTSTRVLSLASHMTGQASTGSPEVQEPMIPVPTATEREIDQQLVERAQHGDKLAFELLVIKYQRKLLRLIGRLVRDPAEAEDVTQDAFIKAYRALGSFRGDSAFYTWLYRIGVNTAKNFLMNQGRRMPSSIGVEEAEYYEGNDLLQDVNTPEAELLSRELARTVNDSMEALPEELKTAIRLREIEGLSYEDIATMMNCPIGTVRSRIFRAREAISHKLKPLLEVLGSKRW
nr:RNA polymerase sigma factor RpoE [Ferrovum sp.]